MQLKIEVLLSWHSQNIIQISTSQKPVKSFIFYQLYANPHLLLQLQEAATNHNQSTKTYLSYRHHYEFALDVSSDVASHSHGTKI